MAMGVETRRCDPFGKFLVFRINAGSAQHEVNFWNHGVEAGGRLNEVMMILEGVKAGGHPYNQRIFRDLQFPAQGESRSWIRSEVMQVEAVRDYLHFIRWVTQSDVQKQRRLRTTNNTYWKPAGNPGASLRDPNGEKLVPLRVQIGVADVPHNRNVASKTGCQASDQIRVIHPSLNDLRF